MKPNGFSNDTYIIKYDDKLQSLLIIHPDKSVFTRPILQFRVETLATMSFQAASRVLGQNLMVMIPQLRDLFKEELHLEDAEKYLEELERSQGKAPD